MAVSEIGKGVAEGLSKELSEKATKAAGRAADKGAEKAETHVFGLGPKDEALYTRAYTSIKGNNKVQTNALKKIVRDYLNKKLSPGQKNWFRRVIAEMGVKDGASFLREFASLEDDETRTQEAQSCGLIEESVFSEVEQLRDDLGEFFRREIARFLEEEGGE